MRSTYPGEARLTWVLRIPAAPDRVGMMRELMDTLDQPMRMRLAGRFPVQIGNCFNGAPFDLCPIANRVAAVGYAETAVGEERDFYRGLVDPVNPGAVQPEPRQILYLNPEERSGLIEAHGNVATAENVGVYQPGAKTDHASLFKRNAIARGFVDARPQGDLAMIMCAMGSFPGHTGASRLEMYRAAADRRPADRLAQRLRDFMSLLRLQTTEDITLLGHSLGGLISGIAAASGVDADRLVMVNGAGSGLRSRDARGFRNRDHQPISTFVLDHPEDYVIGTRLATPHFGPGVGQLTHVTHLAAPAYIPNHPDLPDELDNHTDLLRPCMTSFDDVLGVLTGGPYRSGEPMSDPKARAQRILDVVVRGAVDSDQPTADGHAPPAAKSRRPGRSVRAR